MNKYIIHGGRPLFGEVTISGAKNAAVAIIPAALLVDGVCRIENIPQISDVTLFFSILDELGARVRVLNQHAVEIDCRTGCVLAIIVPGPGRLCWFLGRDFEYVIPWRCIVQIGSDIILVDVKEEDCRKKCE